MKNRRQKFALLLASLVSVTLLWGCGSSGSGGSNVSTAGPAAAQSVGSSSCQVCHSAVVAEGWVASPHQVAGDTSAGCEGCHGGGQFHRGLGPIPVAAPNVTDCATCHEATSPGFLARHMGDDAATGYGAEGEPTVEGYVFTACTDCHGAKDDNANTLQWAHNPASTEINRQWARSAHAGKIAADSPDTESVWGHYDWDAANRASCARCHTATGARNFMSAPGSYVAANNDFSHMEAGQNELLSCNACHSNVATGELRTPGAIVETYPAATKDSPAVTVAYPDAGDSNVCMSCHLGRQVGGNVANDIDADGVRGFINSHYLAAGSTVFGEGGYEFAGQDYTGWTDAKFGRHGEVSKFDARGPCVTCHMSGDEQHSFEVVEKDAEGRITAVATTACDSCHGNMNAAWLEERKETFHEALEGLEAVLEAKGIYYYGAHPYFYTAPYVAGGTNTAFTDWAGVYGLAAWKDVMGAAFNFNLLHHEPGAYAHNRNYAMKLVVDSIDFLADGVIDGNGGEQLAAATKTLGYTIEEKHHGGAALVQANYTVDTTAKNVSCGDCHASGSKTSNGLIIDQFAESAHGDVLGEAWMHYDWRASNRASCQRCHTASGFVAKLGTESDTTNVFAAADVALPGEALRCSACHTDIATGALQAAGAYTATYSNGATLAYPDVAGSNLCVRCHGGREGGDSIKGSAGDFANLSFINSHYLGAAQTLFAGAGYEYDGVSYANVAYFKHDLIGSEAVANTGANGPCIGCHMGSTANHTWEVVAKDAEGVITAINSDACIACHNGTHELTAEELETEVHHFHAALGALQAALEAKGIFFKASHPYFYQADLATAFKNWDGVYTGKGKDVMGAAFNYNLLHHEPGAYAHNRIYTKRLIFDAIDFLDNGALDGTISVTGDAALYLGTARP